MLTLPGGTRPTRSALPIALAPSRRAVGTPTLILTVNIGCSAWVVMSVIHPPVLAVGDDGAAGVIGGSHEAHRVPEADAS